MIIVTTHVKKKARTETFKKILLLNDGLINDLINIKNSKMKKKKNKKANPK